jgi:hypothetical protein
VDAREIQAAWAILRQALPEGWRVREPVFDPDGRQWSVWAVSKPPIKVMPVHGGGSTEAEALVNLAATLRARHPQAPR